MGSRTRERGGAGVQKEANRGKEAKEKELVVTNDEYRDRWMKPVT